MTERVTEGAIGRWGAVCVPVALLLAACGDVPLPSAESECSQGEAKCEGTSIVLCNHHPDEVWRWGEPEACPDGGQCQGGTCVADCGVCDKPPDSCHKSPGLCVNAQCIYDPAPDGTSCDDGDPCTTNDGCVNGLCRGKPMACDSPPGNTCKDDKLLEVHSPVGLCVDGACSYPATDVVCPMGCEAGACKGDPCQGVTCNQPPGDCFMQGGFCSGGQCHYYYDDGKACDDADACTTNDKCSGGKCFGSPKVCVSPPAASCADANTAVIYENQGTCSGGTCSYPKKTVSCSHGCDAATGACKSDPCAAVTCDSPPSSCYKTPGTCNAGQCTYQLDNGKACDDGDPCTQNDTCSSGACQGSTITCNSPPANTCKDASTLTVYTAPGTCSGGSCTYGSADMQCPFGCDSSNGICKGDPCANVTCNTPPNNQCYSVPGICSSGSCTYFPTSGDSCNDSDPCTQNDICNSNGGCAGEPFTCEDNLSCTANICDGSGGCTFTLQSGFCLIGTGSSQTCYQANATNPSNACQYCDPATSTSGWQLASGTALVTWSFDSGLAGFTITPAPATSPVKWQVDTTRSVRGSSSLYFGDVATHTYADGSNTVSGEATSPSVSLPTGQGKLCLTFQMFKHTELGGYYDLLTIEVVGGSQPIWSSANEPSNANTGSQFVSFAVDISSEAGNSVQLRFSFDSIDGILNDYEGVYLDDITVQTNCSP